MKKVRHFVEYASISVLKEYKTFLDIFTKCAGVSFFKGLENILDVFKKWERISALWEHKIVWYFL